MQKNFARKSMLNKQMSALSDVNDVPHYNNYSYYQNEGFFS